MSHNPSGQPRLSLAKGSVAGLDPRVRCVVEASTSLDNWSTVGVAIIENSANRITADYTLPFDGVFMRLSVTMDP
jgi:hypothetical protein